MFKCLDVFALRCGNNSCTALLFSPGPARRGKNKFLEVKMIAFDELKHEFLEEK